MARKYFLWCLVNFNDFLMLFVIFNNLKLSLQIIKFEEEASNSFSFYDKNTEKLKNFNLQNGRK